MNFHFRIFEFKKHHLKFRKYQSKFRKRIGNLKKILIEIQKPIDWYLEYINWYLGFNSGHLYHSGVSQRYEIIQFREICNYDLKLDLIFPRPKMCLTFFILTPWYVWCGCTCTSRKFRSLHHFRILYILPTSERFKSSYQRIDLYL